MSKPFKNDDAVAPVRGKLSSKAIERPPRDRALKREEVERREAEAEAEADVTKRRPNALSRNILPLFLCLCVCLAGRAATVTGNLLDISVAALQTKITFTPTNTVLVTGGGLSAGPPKTITATNGAFSIVLDPGDYTVCLPLVPTRSCFGISVFATNGSVNITNLLSGPVTYSYTNQLDYRVRVSGSDAPGLLGEKLAAAGPIALSTNAGQLVIGAYNGNSLTNINFNELRDAQGKLRLFGDSSTLDVDDALGDPILESTTNGFTTIYTDRVPGPGVAPRFHAEPTRTEMLSEGGTKGIKVYESGNIAVLGTITNGLTVKSDDNVSTLHLIGSAGTGGIDVGLSSTPAGLSTSAAFFAASLAGIGSAITALNASELTSGTVPPARLPLIYTNKLMSVPSGGSVYADMAAATSQFIGQLGLAWPGSGKDTYMFSAAAVGTGSNAWSGQVNFPNGVSSVGSGANMPMGKANYLQLWFNGNSNDTSLASAPSRDATALYIMNPNVHTDGAWLLVPMFTTDPASFGSSAVGTNNDGEKYGFRDQFGLQFGTIPFEQRSPLKNLQNGSYQIIMGAGGGVPFYITANCAFSNEPALGVPIQHNYACFDQTKYQTHFPWWITNVWYYTNTAWRDVVNIDHLTARLEILQGCENAPADAFYNGAKKTWFTNQAGMFVVGPAFTSDAEANGTGFLVTTNVQFGANGDPWCITWDSVGFGRQGVLKQSGQHSKYVAAAGAPLILGHSDGSDIRVNKSGQTVTANLTIDSSGNTSLSGSLGIGGGTAIGKVMSASATLDFGSTSAQTSSELTITVTGAAVGDPVALSTPAAPNANTCFTAYVSAADTVKVRFNNYSSGAIDPASGTYRAAVTHF